MSDNNISAERRRRVNRIKVYLVTIFLILVITPSVISVYALKRLDSLNSKVSELEEQLSQIELTYLLKEQADDSLEKMEMEKLKAEEERLAALAKEQAAKEEEDDNRKCVYLTFDDGPSANTMDILEVLDKYDVKATFFVTGYQAEKHPEWYKEIVNRGHTIGMHSYTHVYNSIYASEDDFIKDVESIYSYIEDTTGVKCKFYRFPGGSSNHVSKLSMHELCELIHSSGYEYFDWNVSSQDANTPSPDKSAIVSNVLAGVDKNQDEVIVLMHDAAEKNATVEALPEIIEGIQKRENTVILPITEDTKAIQHLDITLSGN